MLTSLAGKLLAEASWRIPGVLVNSCSSGGCNVCICAACAKQGDIRALDGFSSGPFDAP